MSITRTLFQPLGDDAKKIKIVKPIKQKEKEKVPEKENEDHLMIKSILWDQLKLTPAYEIRVTSTRIRKEKIKDTLKIFPEFRANILRKNYLDDDCKLYVWKSFWVTKDGEDFKFNPDLKDPQILKIGGGWWIS